MYQFGIDKYGADCRELRGLLKSIDKLFDIEFNYDGERYRILFNGALFRTVWWGEMSGDVIDEIKKAYWINVNGDPIAEMDESNAAVDAAGEKRRADMIRELAKDLRWAINKEF